VIVEDNGPNTYISESRISGMGLFAGVDLNIGNTVIDYNPFIKSFYEIKWVDLSPEQYNRNWLLPINDNFCKTNDKPCKFHYLNHSRTPNCYWDIKNLLVISNSYIKKGSELFIDYRLEYRPNRLYFPDWV
jgi:hypothetical protein